jgi:pyruvate formate lyase activating enzyme
MIQTGRIFDIREFSVFDGPGIRTTVFLKGCPLHCKWCHNPEGISFNRQLMVSISACTGCGACKRVCKKTVCDACGACISVCPQNLRRIAGQDITAGELADQLLKGKDLLQSSGGGVTFSGGEPLAQWPFVKAVIDGLEGLHTAVETSGAVGDEVFLDMMHTVDLVLMDIKHTDDQVHKMYTGSGNGAILHHVQMLVSGETPFIIRVPLIPGVNDTEENMAVTAHLIKGAKAFIRVELLPYHVTAGAKYGMVGMAFDPGFDTSRPVHIVTHPFEEKGIPVLVL